MGMPRFSNTKPQASDTRREVALLSSSTSPYCELKQNGGSEVAWTWRANVRFYGEVAEFEELALQVKSVFDESKMRSSIVNECKDSHLVWLVEHHWSHLRPWEVTEWGW